MLIYESCKHPVLCGVHKGHVQPQSTNTQRMRKWKILQRRGGCWVRCNVYQLISRGIWGQEIKVWGEREERVWDERREKRRWGDTHSASTWATGHLYCAVLNKQISAYCRTVGREQGHAAGLATLDTHTRAVKVTEVHKTNSITHT